MNYKHGRNLLIAVATTLIATSHAALAADTVRSGDPSRMHLWQGRAGGLVGYDHIANLRNAGGREQVSIAFDKDVVKRTNMQRTDEQFRHLAVSFDKEVAERT